MIKFKNPALKNEFENLHPHLRKILFWLAGYAEYHWDMPVVITELFRTQAEQEAIYGAGTEKKSVHQYGRGADISVVPMNGVVPPEEIAEKINANFPYSKLGLNTALYHEVGNRGKHIHIQVGA